MLQGSQVLCRGFQKAEGGSRSVAVVPGGLESIGGTLQGSLKSFRRSQRVSVCFRGLMGRIRRSQGFQMISGGPKGVPGSLRVFQSGTCYFHAP